MRRLATGRLVRTFRLLVIPLFTDEHTMVEHDFALRAGGDERIVRHDDDRSALLVQLTEQVEHDLLIPLIEIAGRLVGEQWNDEEAKRAYEAAGGKPAFTGSAAEGAQNGGIAISFADPTKAAKTGDTDAANVAVAAGVADDTDVEPDVTKGEQA